MKERSLVVFTLATQAAVGMVIWLVVLSAFGGVQASNYRMGLAWALGLSSGAMIVSFLHLGSPLKSIYALRNLKKSWLSREVALASAFTLCLGFSFLSALQSAAAWRAGWVSLSALVGVGLVFAMANVYRLRTAPGWTSAFTGPGFFLTSLLLGGSALAMTAFSSQAPSPSRALLGLGLLFCLLAQIVIALLDGFYPARTVTSSHSFKSQWTGLRIVSLLAAVVALLFWSALVSAGLILLAELVGRIEFYVRRSRMGI